MSMSINLSTSFKFTLSFAAVAGLLLGCGEKPAPAEAKPDKSAEYQQQIRDLTAERDRLKAEVQELSRSPSAILADLTSALASKDASKAEKAQAELEKRFPKTAEAADGKKQIATYRDGLAKAAAEEHRMATLGFKALPASLSIKGPSVTAKFGDLSFAARFVMDRYDDTYHYRDADRDTKYAVMSMSVTAAKGVSNPDLPGAALYWADGATLKKLGDFSVEFTRWESYATYLGNYSDSRNDFAKVQTIPFALGVQITDEEVKKRPLYVVATKEGCIGRRYERFRNPPDYYLGVCTPLKSTLTVKDFIDSDGKLAVILRRD